MGIYSAITKGCWRYSIKLHLTLNVTLQISPVAPSCGSDRLNTYTLQTEHTHYIPALKQAACQHHTEQEVYIPHLYSHWQVGAHITYNLAAFSFQTNVFMCSLCQNYK